MAGLFRIGQLSVAVSRTEAVPHWSVAVAVKLALTEQALAGAGTLTVKLAEALGASVATVKTAVPGTLSLTTTTLVSVTLPGLLTVPPKMTFPPTVVGVDGQLIARSIWPRAATGQVAVRLALTVCPVQRS